MASALSYFASQHRRLKKDDNEQTIGYNSLYRTLTGDSGRPVTLSQIYNPIDLCLWTQQVINAGRSGLTSEQVTWTAITDINRLGMQQRQVITHARLARQPYVLDDQPHVVHGCPVLLGEFYSGKKVLLVLEIKHMRYGPGAGEQLVPLGFALCAGDEESLQEAMVSTTAGLQTSALFKNRFVLMNKNMIKVYTEVPNPRTWEHLVPNPHLQAELEFITKSLQQMDKLREEGINLKRGLMVSGPPGIGKSASLQVAFSSLVGKTTTFVVESVGAIRQVYDYAVAYAPALIVFEDIDLFTQNRADPYARGDETATGELLQVLSGNTEYRDVITIATTNHPEAIDAALKERAGRFDAHVRVDYPDWQACQAILDLYLAKHGIEDTVAAGVRRIFDDLRDTVLTGAHVEEYVSRGVRTAALEGRQPTAFDFRAGVASIKSISHSRPKAT